MMSDCSSIRMQSTSCCFSSNTDIYYPLPIHLTPHLPPPQFPRPHAAFLINRIREAAFFEIEGCDGRVFAGSCRRPESPKSRCPMLYACIDFCVDGSKHRSLQCWSAGHAPVPTHQHDILVAQRGGERNPFRRIANEHVGGAELLTNVKYRGSCREECRCVKHSLKGNPDQSKRDHRG